MGGCSAPNCTNHSRKGIKMFTFPTEAVRRKKWIINCRRDKWIPGPGVQLCIAHFEDSQFEQNRADKWRKLKPTAIPTLFDVPNPPPQIARVIRVKGKGIPKPGSILHQDPEFIKSNEITEPQSSNESLLREIETLKKENELLKKCIEDQDSKFSFLSNDQLSALEKKDMHYWSAESIIKGLKLRFALGKHGYNYLRSTGYPCPSYSTLSRRIQSIKINFGVLEELVYLLKTKIENMDARDKYCCMIVDEMEISAYQDFDTSLKSFVGNTTLGNLTIANHYTVVLLRSLKNPWKQVIAHELTAASTSGQLMKDLMIRAVEAARRAGLNVKATLSDMGSNNKALWNSLGISVSRNERRSTYEMGNSNEQLYSIADVPHLIKNLRNAFLSNALILPVDICNSQDLPTNMVSRGYLKQLWISEIKSDSSLRSLHHLKQKHLFPTHFSKMNVAEAVQLFSVKTAAAIEKGVSLKQLKREALTTAWWIRLVYHCFRIMTGRHRKRGITLRNKTTIFEFFEHFLSIFQHIEIGNSWKPVQTGIIMSTISIRNLANEMFSNGSTFFLPGRLTQDALENLFSQIRRKSGAKPTALQAKRALKLICISQFISDVKNACYANDSDCHLLNFCRTNSLNSKKSLTPVSGTCDEIAGPSNEQSRAINLSEANEIFFIAGATVHSVIQRRLCKTCLIALHTCVDSDQPVVPANHTLLNEYCDKGGLKTPTSGIYKICIEAEKFLQKQKNILLTFEENIDKDFTAAIKNNCTSVVLPACCNLIDKIINHYLVVRCQGIKNHLINKKAHKMSYSSKSLCKNNIL